MFDQRVDMYLLLSHSDILQVTYMRALVDTVFLLLSFSLMYSRFIHVLGKFGIYYL